MPMSRCWPIALEGGTYCTALEHRTVVVVDVLELKAMEQKMVTVKAEEMAQSITTDGHVAWPLL